MFSVLRNRRLPCWGDEKCRNTRKYKKKNILVGDTDAKGRVIIGAS
jgi:hypothetical protein